MGRPAPYRNGLSTDVSDDRGLQEPAYRYADHVAGPNHQVIEQPHPDQSQRSDQFLGDDSIGRARFWVSAGMFVRQDGRPSIDGEGRPDDFPRVDAGAVVGAGEEPLAIEDSMPGVEPDDVERFMEQRPEAHPEEGTGVFGVADAALSFQFGPKEGFGGAEDILLGDGAAGLVVALTILDEAHGVLPRSGIAPWAPVSGAKKGGRHRNATAVRRREGGNNVDEGLPLRPPIAEPSWPTTGYSN